MTLPEFILFLVCLAACVLVLIPEWRAYRRRRREAERAWREWQETVRRYRENEGPSDR